MVAEEFVNDPPKTHWIGRLVLCGMGEASFRNGQGLSRRPACRTDEAFSKIGGKTGRVEAMAPIASERAIRTGGEEWACASPTKVETLRIVHWRCRADPLGVRRTCDEQLARPPRHEEGNSGVDRW